MSVKTANANQIRKTVRKKHVAKPAARAQTSQADRLVLQRAVANPASASPADIQTLQRAYGNRAVTGLIQAKLKVGPAGDKYEQEADRVAQQVMGMSTPVAVGQAGKGSQLAQRQAEEEEVQMKPARLGKGGLPLAASITPLVQRQQEEEEVQMKRRQGADGSFQASPGLQTRLAAHQGGGQPLPAHVRAFMEPRFGADFSNVRVHADGEAAQMSQRLSAQAFTHGQDIYLSAGQYSPGSDAGKRLLAHELTHVVQQSGAQARANDVSTLRIQRALNFEPTNWKDTQQISWVKGQDHPDHDNVLGFSGGGGTRLWVKTNESVAEARAAASLVASAAQIRAGRMPPGQTWRISTPQVREAAREDRTGMVNKLGKLQPKPSRVQKRQLKATLLQAADVHISTHAGGEMGDQPVPQAQEPWLQDPGFRRALGYVGLLDIIMANFDRIIGMVGPQNWKVERPNPTLHLIDNLQRGFGFDLTFEQWSQNPWIQFVRARNWAGMKAQLMGYWAADPQFQMIPANQQDAWVNDFMAGMQEAWGDLDAVRQALQASMPPSPKRDVLIQRIVYLRGWQAGHRWRAAHPQANH
ncbi:MAG: DUF4157 domain-containing protein [Anaerolineales bacterium]|nr:MAG: DUF4157 domain-containing protein [Anaerolineales bacterium]